MFLKTFLNIHFIVAGHVILLEEAIHQNFNNFLPSISHPCHLNELINIIYFIYQWFNLVPDWCTLKFERYSTNNHRVIETETENVSQVFLLFESQAVHFQAMSISIMHKSARLAS